jgi:hypothetical protein
MTARPLGLVLIGLALIGGLLFELTVVGPRALAHDLLFEVLGLVVLAPIFYLAKAAVLRFYWWWGHERDKGASQRRY